MYIKIHMYMCTYVYIYMHIFMFCLYILYINNETRYLKMRKMGENLKDKKADKIFT